MKKLLAVALLCSAAATPVLAQSTRYYGALDYGTLNMSGPWSSTDALTLSAGYQFAPHVAAEAGVTLIGASSANIPGTGRVSINQTLLSAVAVGVIPINPSFNLFGKAGVGLHNGTINGLPDDLIYGLGGQLLLNPKLSLRLQYESLGRTRVPNTTSWSELSRLAFGATYNF